MKPEYWKKLESVFNEALELPPPERTAFLDTACGGDSVLRAEVDSMLRIHSDDTGDVQAIVDRGARDYAESDPDPWLGQEVGAFRIVQHISEGGMGTVYRGERTGGEFTQSVAIKLLSSALISTQARQRFRGERQILANLNHPNVASLLDGGATDTGVPFLAMEYIDGVPVDVYCDQQRLDLGGRLRLFLKICDAVQYAHRNLVVHRDIKPNNILVTPDGEPKLLDFGIAKLLDLESVDFTVAVTRPEARLLTPEYASPEQVRGDSVTTATDVYGLGVLLYLMLCGSAPFQITSYRQADVERAICDTPAPRPSAQALRASADAVAARRHGSAATLARVLAGDLDNIVLLAMHKEAERRYPSVAQFAADIERHLNHQPVQARPDSALYKTTKFVRRHRTGVGVTATMVTTIATLITFYTMQLAAERDLAEQRRITAEQTSEFLIDIFESSDPNENRGADLPASELLRRGIERIDALQDEPQAQATLMQTIGRVHQKLGLYEAALPTLRRALATREALFDPNHPDVAEAANTLAEGLFETGNYDEAEQLYRRALALRAEHFGRRNLNTTQSMDGLATVLAETGRLDEALTLDREVLAIELELLGDTDIRVAQAYTNLGHVLRRSGALEEAQHALAKSLEIKRNLLGNMDLETAHTLNQLARVRTLRGDHEAALPLAREGLTIREQILTPPHAEIGASLGNVAGILQSLGRFDESEATRRQSLAMLSDLLGNQHPYIAGTLNSLASVILAAGRLEDAEAAYREALAAHRAILPPGHPNNAYPLTGLGRVLNELGRHAEAETVLADGYELRMAGLPADHWQTASTGAELGFAMLRQGRADEAAAYLHDSRDILSAAFGDDDPRTARVSGFVAELDDAGDR